MYSVKTWSESEAIDGRYGTSFAPHSTTTALSALKAVPPAFHADALAPLELMAIPKERPGTHGHRHGRWV